MPAEATNDFDGHDGGACMRVGWKFGGDAEGVWGAQRYYSRSGGEEDPAPEMGEERGVDRWMDGE